MKKLILSAVTMMAFVGTSFGKSGEVEVEGFYVKLEQNEVVLSPGCDAAGRAAIRWYFNNTAEPSFNAGVALRIAVTEACNAAE